MHRQIARSRFDLHGSSDRFCTVFRRIVDLGRGLFQRFLIQGSDIALVDSPFRNGVDGLSTFGKDAVNTDVVVFPECFPKHVHGIVEEDESIQRVDSLVRRHCRMGRLSFEGNAFVDEAAQGAVQGIMVIGLAHGVQMDEKIFLIEHSCRQHVYFTADIVDFLVLNKLISEDNIRELLARSKVQ